jgi:predicted 2-oxoglutarate/Fe(II)-dependent dioxygenase YbiX
LRWASFFWIRSLVKDGGARAFFDNLDHSIIKTRAGAATRTKRRWGGVYANLPQRHAKV